MTSDVAEAWKLTYAAGAVITVSGNPIWRCNAPGRVLSGVYWDATNQLMHAYYQMGSTYVLNAINTSLAPGLFCQRYRRLKRLRPAGSPGTARTSSITATSPAPLAVVQVTASASAYTFRTELGTPTLAAAATGGSLYWDGSTMIYLANEGDAKIRVTGRSAQDSYTGWADAVTAPLCAATRPAIVRKAGTLTSTSSTAMRPRRSMV